MQHLLTVDVEAVFRGLRTDRVRPVSDPDLPAAMDLFLDLLESVNAHATFFVLGDDASNLTRFLSRCVASGHEVACHGMRHVRADALSPDEFRKDLEDAISALEDAAQVRCRGYRAPWFSAPSDEDWFFQILREHGIRYDASLRLPIETRLAGESRDGIVLLPVPMLKFGAARIGAVGGLALRVLPRAVTSRMIRRCEQYHQPACVYLHPYEWYAPGPGRSAKDRRSQAGLLGGGMPRGSMSAIRRGFLTERSLPRLKWLAGQIELTSIEKWLRGVPKLVAANGSPWSP